MLSAVRQSPGGGQDLYASPDGGVYRRQNDGWYSRQSGGGWKFYAPTQGTIQRNQVADARGGQPGGAGGVYRPSASPAATGARAQAIANRVPNSGQEARAQEVAALERQYYARSLAQARAQNYRASGQFSRPSRAVAPARPAGRRR
jgi:hypothetical protein